MVTIKQHNANTEKGWAMRVLWRDERERFLEALNRLPPTHRERNRALLLVAYDTGCRVSELVTLDVDDYDRQRQSLLMINSKAVGHPRREVPIHYRTSRALHAWLRLRDDTVETSALFVSQKRQRLSIRQINAIYTRICELADIPARGIHTLRHTMATRLLDDNVLPVHQLSRRLGHRSIQTTYKYYVHQSVEEEARSIRNSRF